MSFLSTVDRVVFGSEPGPGAVVADRDPDMLLETIGLEVAYDQVQVLFGIDLRVARGECVALLGTNGAGKSTVLKGITGLVDPVGGTVVFDGVDMTHAGPVACAAAGIVMVPGGKAVFPTVSVADHLRAAGWLLRDRPHHLAERTEAVLETFPRLRERDAQLAGDLSGGEQQQLALGMAFIAEPELLVIDELSLGLAPAIVEQLLRIVRRMRADGTTIVLVEQSINVALTVADRAYFLEKGQVRFEGPTSDLLDRDDIARSVFFAAGTIGDAGGLSRTEEAQARSIGPEEERPVVLRLDGVQKRFGGILAVGGCSFELRAGETLGLIGPNGAGKTTVFDLISGFLVPDAGGITFEGRDVGGASPDARARAGLGRSFQDARLVPSLTVAENIAIGLDRHLEIRDHVASAMGLPAVHLLEEDVAWSVSDLIELLGLGAYRDKFVGELSTGSRRIVDIAMCIAHSPSVLLLDEPSSGIAQRETEAMGPVLRRIQEETGCALLIIEHDMPLICALSDRMIALDQGRPIAEGTPHEVITDPFVVRSYLGGDPDLIEPATRAGDDVPHRTPRRRAPLHAGDRW